MSDADRIDFLESLLTRTEDLNPKKRSVPARSDMHFGGNRCTIYVRDLLANIVACGDGGTVREAIDAAMLDLRTSSDRP